LKSVKKYIREYLELKIRESREGSKIVKMQSYTYREKEEISEEEAKKQVEEFRK
jgi:hypothetical protein